MTKKLLAVSLFLFSINTYSAEKAAPKNVIQDAFKSLIRKEPEVKAGPIEVPSSLSARNSKYFYVELVPKEKVILTFKAQKRCSDDTDKISVQDFEVIKFYHSAELEKRVPVRVKNYYAESFSVCSNNPTGTIEKKVVIGPFKNKMTHIRITTSDSISVERSGDCGEVPVGFFFDDFCNKIAK
jgi:hypothetical protein